MSDNNSNVGRNDTSTTKVCEDIHFDLGPTAGTDTVGTRTGAQYTPAELLQIAVDRGMVYKGLNDELIALTDVITCIELDLKPVGGEGYHEGDDAQFVTSTTSDASYVNNGARTDIDPGGGRNEGQKGQNLPTSIDSLWVCNGSVGTVHFTVCRELAPAK